MIRAAGGGFLLDASPQGAGLVAAAVRAGFPRSRVAGSLPLATAGVIRTLLAAEPRRRRATSRSRCSASPRPAHPAPRLRHPRRGGRSSGCRPWRNAAALEAARGRVPGPVALATAAARVLRALLRRDARRPPCVRGSGRRIRPPAAAPSPSRPAGARARPRTSSSWPLDPVDRVGLRQRGRSGASPALDDGRRLTVDEAFAHCEARVRAALRELPGRAVRARGTSGRYVHALYAFARAADDFADEPMLRGHARGEARPVGGAAARRLPGRGRGPHLHRARARPCARLDIPKALLLDLLSAFRQDTVKSRYETWDELLDYCRRSADPVGRLVLLVFGYRDPALLAAVGRASAPALQLANHWQDLAIDLRKRPHLRAARAAATATA